jgi:hypothetical protein
MTAGRHAGSARRGHLGSKSPQEDLVLLLPRGPAGRRQIFDLELGRLFFVVRVLMREADANNVEPEAGLNKATSKQRTDTDTDTDTHTHNEFHHTDHEFHTL